VELVKGARGHHLAATALAALSAIAAAYLLTWHEDIRLLVTAATTVAFIGLFIASPRAALLVAMSWLPLSGLFRRLLDVVSPTVLDPVLLTVPLFTACAIPLTMYGHRASFMRGFGRSWIVKCVVGLTVILLFGVVNPVQEDILAGIAGAFFLLIPVLWFYLGRAYLDADAMRRLLLVVGLIGLLSGTYGLYQGLVGLLPFDEQWVINRGFASLYVGGFVRPFATFPNPEEWSRYMAIGATVALGCWLDRTGRRSLWLVVLAVTGAAVVLSGVRTSVVGLLLSVTTLLVLRARTWRSRTVRLALAAVTVATTIWLLPVPSRLETRASNVAWYAFFGHTLRGVSQPLDEDSLRIRLETWEYLLTDTIVRHPLGMGLGVPTLGARRFEASTALLTESYLFSLIIAAGIPAGVAFLGLLLFLGRHMLGLVRLDDGGPVAIVGAILANVILTSMVGNSLALYTVGPLGWSLMGWVSAQSARVRGDQPGSNAAPAVRATRWPAGSGGARRRRGAAGSGG
jgi:hypothetical protein